MNDRLPEGNGDTDVDATPLSDEGMLARPQTLVETPGQILKIASWVRQHPFLTAGIGFVSFITSTTGEIIFSSGDPNEADQQQLAKGAAVLALTEAEIEALAEPTKSLDETLISPVEEKGSPAETEVASVHAAVLASLE